MTSREYLANAISDLKVDNDVKFGPEFIPGEIDMGIIIMAIIVKTNIDPSLHKEIGI